WNNEVDGVKLGALERIARALGVKAIDLIEEVPDTAEHVVARREQADAHHAEVAETIQPVEKVPKRW
ncbi:MAG: hypothetical protein JO183_05990, partial [Ktedonobacteraceae bacterium]|nr:hypothetical protein [Ktedonobacteraceae bacterium]